MVDAQKNIQTKQDDYFENLFNQLNTLSVSGLSNLTYLYARSNGLTSLDLSQNTSLRTLQLGGNTFMPDVSNLINLEGLECANMGLTNINLTNNNNETALHIASIYDLNNFIELLVDLKCEINIREKSGGLTPIMLCILNGNNAGFDILIKRKNEINLKYFFSIYVPPFEKSSSAVFKEIAGVCSGETISSKFSKVIGSFPILALLNISFNSTFLEVPGEYDENMGVSTPN